MKKSFFIVLALVLLLSSCLQTETKIVVAPNGAGTIEQTFILRNDVVEMMRGMQAFDPSKADLDLFDEAGLRQEAERMGEGVSFVSSSSVKTPKGEGYKAVYSFRDISRIRLDQTPGNALMGRGMDGMGPEGSGEYISFAFGRGNPAQLVVHLYQSDDDDFDWDDDYDDDDDESLMDAEMLRQFYGDMKMRITLEAGRTILDTNADYRQGNTITLIDVDFDALSKTPEAFETLAKNKIETLEEMKEFSRRYPGLRLETKKEVSLRFR